MESVASILNKHGAGTLYFGVRPSDGEVVGRGVSEKTLRDIPQAFTNRIEPRMVSTIEHLVTENGKSYVKVTFYGDERPYACDGRYRIHSADEDLPMSMGMPESMMLERASTRDPWGRRPSGRPVTDVSEEALKRFVKEGNACGRIEAPYYTSAREVLSRLSLIAGDGSLANAASVLFCSFRIGVRLKASILVDHSRVEIIDRQRYDGPIYDLIGRAEFYILSNIRRRLVIGGNIEREEIPEIPRAAFREAVVNAFCHRAYTGYGTAVQVEIYPDTVEVRNPGTFPVDRPPEMYLSDETVAPSSRKPLIANTLFRSKTIEAFGSGIRRIRDTCAAAGVRSEYVQGPCATTVRFHRNDPFARTQVEDSSAVPAQGVLSHSASRVLGALSRTPGHTAASLAGELGMSPRQAQRALKELREAGCIEREGSRKNGCWRVLRHPVS